MKPSLPPLIAHELPATLRPDVEGMDPSPSSLPPTPGTKPKLQLGRIVATPGALHALSRSGETAAAYLARHAVGDWGVLSAEDRALNDEAVAHEGNPDRQQRVLSAYETRRGDRIWIITEWDRSVTTILLPKDY